MCIEQINQSSVRISLDEADLVRLHLSFEEINGSDPHTRQVLLELLECARRKTGFSPAGLRLLVEVCRSQQGLSLLFSVLGESHTPFVELDSCPTTPVVFRFTDLDDMVLGAGGLFSQYGHRVFRSSLYRLEDQYQLVIYPLDRAENTAARYLGEFGKMVGKGGMYAAYLEEHGKALIRDNALDKITYYLA